MVQTTPSAGVSGFSHEASLTSTTARRFETAPSFHTELEARLMANSLPRGRHVTIGDWRVRTLNAGFNPFRDVVLVVVLPLMVGNLICWVMP